MPRRRAIKVLELAQRIEAELASGRVDDVEMSDEQVERVANLLRPGAPTPTEESTVEPGAVARLLGRAVQGVAAAPMVPVLLSLGACAPVMS